MWFHTKPSAEGFEIFLGCAAPLFTSVLNMFSRSSGNLGLELSRGAVEFLKFLCEFFRETLLKVSERSRVQFPRWDEWCYSEKKEGKKTRTMKRQGLIFKDTGDGSLTGFIHATPKLR